MKQKWKVQTKRGGQGKRTMMVSNRKLKKRNIMERNKGKSQRQKNMQS